MESGIKWGHSICKIKFQVCMDNESITLCICPWEQRLVLFNFIFCYERRHLLLSFLYHPKWPSGKTNHDLKALFSFTLDRKSLLWHAFLDSLKMDILFPFQANVKHKFFDKKKEQTFVILWALPCRIHFPWYLIHILISKLFEQLNLFFFKSIILCKWWHINH